MCSSSSHFILSDYHFNGNKFVAEKEDAEMEGDGVQQALAVLHLLAEANVNTVGAADGEDGAPQRQAMAGVGDLIQSTWTK